MEGASAEPRVITDVIFDKPHEHDYFYDHHMNALWGLGFRVFRGSLYSEPEAAAAPPLNLNPTPGPGGKLNPTCPVSPTGREFSRPAR